MLEHNRKMQAYLASHGIYAIPKRIDSGSLKGTWRLYGKIGDRDLGTRNFQPQTPELREKLTALGFTDFNGKPLSEFSGNGGLFSVFVRQAVSIPGEE